MEMKQDPQHGGYAQPAGQTTVIVQNQAKPNSYLILSCFVYWCCNFPLGAVAFALSMASKSAADDNDFETARSRGIAAKWVSVAGIILTLLIIIILVILYFTAFHLLMGQAKSLQDQLAEQGFVFDDDNN